MRDRFLHVLRSASQSTSSSGQSYQWPRTGRTSGRPRHRLSTSLRDSNASRLDRPGETSTCKTSSVSRSTAARTYRGWPSTLVFVSSTATSCRSRQSGSNRCKLLEAGFGDPFGRVGTSHRPPPTQPNQAGPGEVEAKQDEPRNDGDREEPHLYVRHRSNHQ